MVCFGPISSPKTRYRPEPRTSVDVGSAAARPRSLREVNKTLSAGRGHNNTSCRWQQQHPPPPHHTHTPAAPTLTVFVMEAAASCSSLRPAQHRPALMTAHIPKVDSCYAADLTGGSSSHPSTPPATQSRGKRGSTSVRKRGANVRARAAVCCTSLHWDCTKARTGEGPLVNIDSLRVPACLVIPPLPALPAAHRPHPLPCPYKAFL